MPIKSESPPLHRHHRFNPMKQNHQFLISRARKSTLHRIYKYLMRGIPKTDRVKAHPGLYEFVNHIEEALFKNAVSLGEYWDTNTLANRIDDNLRQLISTCIVGSNSMGNPFMSSTLGECIESNVSKFPNPMDSEHNETPNYYQSNMIPNSLVSMGGQTLSELMMQRGNILNSTDVSFCLKDPTSPFTNESMGSSPVYTNRSMVHVHGPDMSERKLNQMAPNEPDQLTFSQHRQEAANHSLQVPAEKQGMPCQPCLQVGSTGHFKNRETMGLKKVSIEGSATSKTASYEITTEPSHTMLATRTSKDLNDEANRWKKRQMLLYGLGHARICNILAEEKCRFPDCINLKRLLRHIAHCKGDRCSCPHCHDAKLMIAHHRQCKDPSCPICLPVKRKFSELKTPSGVNRVPFNTNITSTVETCKDFQSPPKRAKIDVSDACIPTTKKPLSGVATNYASHRTECLLNSYDQDQLSPQAEPELKKLKGASHEDPGLSFQRNCEIGSRARDNTSVEALENITEVNLKNEELLQTSPEHVALSADPVTKLTAQLKLDCVSLTELFSPDQVRQHIISLRQQIVQSKVNADGSQSMEHSTAMNQNSCQLCTAGELNFEPGPLYCSKCYTQIKRRAAYYTLGTMDIRYCFCTTCHTAMRGKNNVVCGITFSKCELEKKQYIEHIQEPWVQCDKCQSWQHQICALFNIRMNGEGKAKYTCPNCYVEEIERGDRFALTQAAFLGARDLPRTTLSDHIEQRLSNRMKIDILQRDATQSPIDEKFPGGGDLIVRVVLSVDKKLEVKKNFRGIFHERDYPAEFPYKSKVILLFQNIEGVEVCLFGMYVQEFGSECDFPNRRRVYISYLDSVKHFRPDVKWKTGAGLRTFIYHEILIGYLEYCKTRGFTSCYIWVCPPPKGEDYILYCHPESQRTPKKDKLREWYLSMLKKAMKEDIVVEVTNLYDHFFSSTGESRAKITSGRLPYFDGDFWPAIAEEKLQQFCKEGEKAPCKKSATKKSFTKRSLQPTLVSNISDSESKDMFLIHEIGKKIYPMKEDFIMVHLQHPCTHCSMFITSGNCWRCRECSNFRLCDRCYEAEQCRDEQKRHPLKKSVKHLLERVDIRDIPSDTKDVDGNIESKIFDTRPEFLAFCQKNHYQYDTLRRAKHSSMMLLYHLHNPAAPTLVTTCKICHLDIEHGHGWMCEVCFAYDICYRCYEKPGYSGHPHTLTRHSASTHSMDARSLCASQVQKMKALIVHVSDCHSPSCTHADCGKVKWLFHHATQCTKGVLEGCLSCKKIWHLLQIHSRECLEPKCRVPRCSDLKMHSRRMQQRAEAKHWAADTEMSRQRTAKVNSEVSEPLQV